MGIYQPKVNDNKLPSFRKEGCPPGGVVGQEWFDLFTLYKNRIGVAYAACFSYHPGLKATPPPGRRGVQLPFTPNC